MKSGGEGRRRVGESNVEVLVKVKRLSGLRGGGKRSVCVRDQIIFKKDQKRVGEKGTERTFKKAEVRDLGCAQIQRWGSGGRRLEEGAQGAGEGDFSG